MKVVQTIKNSKPISQRWNESENREALAFEGRLSSSIYVTKQKYSVEKIPDEIINMILKMLKANDDIR